MRSPVVEQFANLLPCGRIPQNTNKPDLRRILHPLSVRRIIPPASRTRVIQEDKVMKRIRHNEKKVSITTLSIGCIILVLVSPQWRKELQAHTCGLQSTTKTGSATGTTFLSECGSREQQRTEAMVCMEAAQESFTNCALYCNSDITCVISRSDTTTKEEADCRSVDIMIGSLSITGCKSEASCVCKPPSP